MILSRIDYGSAVYGSARTSRLKILNSIHYMGLRLALGAYHTSPYKAIWCEAGIPPLEYRRQQFLLSYAVNIWAQPKHPNYKILFDQNIYIQYQNRSTISRSISVRVMELLNSMQESLPPVYNYCPSETPQWKLIPPKFYFECTEFKKSDCNRQLLLTKFYSIVNFYRRGHKLYTDGSKTDQGVDSAFSDGISAYSIYTAELCAIWMALKFHKVFDQDTNQGDVFDTVAIPVINSVLQGFNGTIFAYGQTGSGKTYTITGSPKNYDDRGIIPRSIQFIFSQNEKICVKPTIYISYMEIYNEIGYDLLSSRHSTNARGLEELPRIALLEDGKGEAHIRNLSVLPVTTEQEAMRLLFLGDTNRSERLSKSLATGVTLNEAKYINLSLHYLQQVIVALSEEKRLHIPYRNSMMTYILKDSLSGNCLTVMMATLAASKNNFQETISTCKFAQRVSLITTEPIINELNDPQQEILYLKNRIEQLERQIAELTGMTTGPILSDEQKEQCKIDVEKYLQASTPEEEFLIKPEFRQIQFCFKLFKDRIEFQSKTNELQRLEYYKTQNETVILRKTVLSKEAEITTLKNIIDQIPEKPTNPNKFSSKIDYEIKSQPHPIKKAEEKTNTMPNSKITQLKKSNNFHEKVPALNFRIGETVVGENEKELFEQFIADPSNSKDLRYYTQSLEKKFEMAKIFADTIEHCQRKIINIRQKLQASPSDAVKKKLLCELEEQQDVYSRSLVDLKFLKSETRHLEAGLKQAQIKIEQRFAIWLSEHQAANANNLSRDEQWGDYSDQCDYTVCQSSDQNDGQNHYYIHSPRKMQQLDGQSCYHRDTPSDMQTESALSDQLPYNNSYHYCNSDNARNYFIFQPSCGMKMDQQISSQFSCKHSSQSSSRYNSQIPIQYSCEKTQNNTCLSNRYSTSHQSQDFCADYFKEASYIPEQNCVNKNYDERYNEYSCASKECPHSHRQGNSSNRQQEVYWNNGETFVNNVRQCKSAEPAAIKDFRQKSTSPRKVRNSQNANIVCSYNNVNKLSVDPTEHNRRFSKRNGLEDVGKGTYVQHNKNFSKDSVRNYEMYPCPESHRTESSLNPSDGFKNLPCKDEAVKEVPNLQSGYRQGQVESSNLSVNEEVRQTNIIGGVNNLCLIKATDSPEFVEFLKTVPLTGEAAVDEEICNFYRSKLMY